MRIAIIGRGGMAKSFARTMSDENVTIAYIGRTGGEADLRRADCIVIATPPTGAEDIAARLLSSPNTLVVSLWSYMGHGAKLQHLSNPILYLHCMYGPDITKLTGQNSIVAGAVSHEVSQIIIERLESLGARVHTTSPEEHDKAMAYIQCLSQFNSIVLSLSLAQSTFSREQFYDYASVTFRLNRYAIERIMNQKAELWAELQFENEYFIEVLKNHLTNIERLVRAVESKNASEFTDIFNEAAVLWKAPALDNNRAETVKDNTISDTITLGPAGTYSDLATHQYLNGKTPRYAKTIQEALLAVADREVAQAIVPFENSTQGVVIETLDTLHQQNLVVIDELTLDINHSLCGLEDSANSETIKTIYSHPQALGQCRQYLKRLYPQAEQVPTTSTAAAMQIIHDQKDLNALAIGPEFAATKYGLKVVEKAIEDESGNQTRFFVCAKQASAKQLPFVFMALIPKQDEPGLLHELLTIFKRYGVNLSQIESRPSRIKLGIYMFYVRLDIASDDPRNDIIVKQIEANNIEVRRLSS